MRSLTLVSLVMVGLGPVHAAAADDDLQKAVTLYFSFDKELKADFARGDATISTREGYPQKGQYKYMKGFPKEVFQMWPEKGVHGGAIEFTRRFGDYGRIFVPAKGNLAVKQGAWGGAVSLWLNTDPETKIDSFSDPVQITEHGANNGGIWVDFNNEVPKPLRLGIFPAVKKGVKPIAESDRDAPLVKFEKPGFKVGDWHHVVINWENCDSGKADGTAELFVDGKSKGTLKNRSFRMAWDIDKAGIYIGIGYVGLMDEFAVFNRPLTKDEVERLHEKPGVLEGLKKK